MANVSGRYNRMAWEYLRWWAPVLAPSAARLLDRVAERGADPGSVLDLGCGTGTLALGALRRWPAAQVVGVDASDGMLAVAGEQAAALPPEMRDRLRLVEADAATIPLDDASIDVAVSSFVVQLVDDRAAVLAELARVVRPGGLVGVAGWLGDPRVFAPEDALDDAVEELGLRWPDEDEGPSAGHFRSVRSTAEEFRRAGFRDVSARGHSLDHRWRLYDYARYKERLRDEDLFSAQRPADRSALRSAFRARLERLDPEAFVDRAATVSVVARRP